MSTPIEQALDRIDELVTDENDWLIAATCCGLMIGYDARWSQEQCDIELVECEGCYTAPLTNPDTGRISRTYKTAGKIDKIMRIDGRLCLIDHKTTTYDISDPAGVYWRQLVVDSQASHYELLLLANGIRLDGIIWDVTRKPGIRPKQIAAKDRKAALADGVYCGFNLSTEALEYLAENDRENAELYAARLAAETIDHPDRYFGRRNNPRTREQLEEYAQELWGTAIDMREAKRRDHHFRNCGACFNYGTPCEFLSLCSGSDLPDSDRWQKKPKKNPELPDGIGGSDVLTNSRLRCFATCRRKHYYSYELSIERFDAERREALYMGQCWHEALDAWWLAHNNERQSDGNCNEQSSRRDDSRQSQTELAR